MTQTASSQLREVTREQKFGWVVEMPPEVARDLGLSEKTAVALYANAGNITAEILPPLPADLVVIAEQVLDEDEEFFEEMKRSTVAEKIDLCLAAESNRYGVDEIEAWLRQRATPAG